MISLSKLIPQNIVMVLKYEGEAKLVRAERQLKKKFELVMQIR